MDRSGAFLNFCRRIGFKDRLTALQRRQSVREVSPAGLCHGYDKQIYVCTSFCKVSQYPLLFPDLPIRHLPDLAIV
jgi:hypothetical protein